MNSVLSYGKVVIMLDMNIKNVKLTEAISTELFDTARALFREYAEYINVDLSFQNFSKELDEVEQQYTRPQGVPIVASINEEAIGCFAIRKLEKEVCELKRMYIREVARGIGLGKSLLQESLKQAKALGYAKMRLDTLPSMIAAISLYKKFGFYEIESYRYNPIEGTKYLECAL